MPNKEYDIPEDEIESDKLRKGGLLDKLMMFSRGTRRVKQMDADRDKQMAHTAQQLQTGRE